MDWNGLSLDNGHPGDSNARGAFAHKLFIAGNHDVALTSPHTLACIPPSLTYLENSFTKITTSGHKLHIYGSPYMPSDTDCGPSSISTSTQHSPPGPSLIRSGQKFRLKLTSSSHMVLPWPTLTRTGTGATHCSAHYGASVQWSMCLGTFTLAGV